TANSDHVGILLGNGDGTFQTAQFLAAGDYPRSVTAGDINGDGMIDLVVTVTGGASVLLGQGDGSFALPVTTATGSDPRSAVVADFNADGRPDAAAANAGSHDLSVLINDGDWLVPEPPPATKFYVVDASSDKTFEYDAAGVPLENYSLRSGNNDPRGAASDASGERVWVIDNDDYVYVYDAAGNSLGYWKAKGLSTPEGIASDGTDIWIVDRGTDRVYRFAGAAGRTSGTVSPTSNFRLNSGNKEARGIETDGTYFWIVNDASTDKVFKYTIAGALVGSWTLHGGVTNPTGITLDPSNPSDVWIVDATADSVFQYTAAAGRTSGSQSAAASFSLAAGNSNPQGIADPPPPGAMTALSGQDAAAEFDRDTGLVAAPTGSGWGAALEAAWAAIPEPPAYGLTVAALADEPPLLRHDRPLVSGAFGRGFAPGEFLGTISVEIERHQRQEGESISLSLFDGGDGVFGDADSLGHILDDSR
ncbi:MAG TPA: FG-GAP-like repeat-containing protein, partial [Planctomycetaceae bacterium]|nr:FG-GAP-like repeat-containing protein [Planctomycetaceae bacterium]